MEFYNRDKELKELKDNRLLAKKISVMTVITGRRRIGKTRLILKSVENEPHIYLFVARKEEKLLCSEFMEIIKQKLDIKIFGEISTFKDIFALLIEASKQKHFTLVLDEFQDFKKINPAIYSDMQNIWDLNKEQSNLNLILCGSIYSMMKNIFENTKEPLFGRANSIMNIKPFTVSTLKQIIGDKASNKINNRDLLAFYLITGGVPKYIEYFIEKNIYSFDQMIEEIFRENTILLDEGKNILIEEFGKEYTTYFSILTLIAASKTSRKEIESILEKNVGGFLNRLEKEYNIIKRHKPIFSKPGSRSQKYFIEDNFLNFWFRFVYKYKSSLEIGNYEHLKELVKRDFNAFSGKFLEKYFKQKLAESNDFTAIGNYWDKTGKNEIDIVAINEMNKKALIAEVKLNKKKINLDLLKLKASKLYNSLKDYEITYEGFSLEDM